VLNIQALDLTIEHLIIDCANSICAIIHERTEKILVSSCVVELAAIM